jgi:hypothetical protein
LFWGYKGFDGNTLPAGLQVMTDRNDAASGLMKISDGFFNLFFCFS